MTALLLGHRGDSANFAENTLAAFAAALRCGADGVELDVQVSSDGEPFVLHDATLDRTYPAHGRVDAHTAAELRALGVPHLGEALLLLRDHVTAVELKPSYDEQPGLAQRVLALADPAQRVLLFAFDHRHLQSLPRGAVGVPLWSGRPARQRDFSMLAVEWHAIDAELCRQAEVIAWTVDTADDARALLDMGVAAIITNRPCALRDVVHWPRRSAPPRRGPGSPSPRRR